MARRQRGSSGLTVRDTIELPYEPPPSDDYARDHDRFSTRTTQYHGDADMMDADRWKLRQYLAQSRKRFLTAQAASDKFRQQMRIDQRFAAGGGAQWEPMDRASREGQGRPCIEINRIPQFIRQVSNQNRANRSQIMIAARGKGSTVKLANALQGLVRSVEVESDADVAYDTATEHQLRSGMGFVRLLSQWAPDDDFQQVCRLRRIRNPLSVYWDPSTQEGDFGDMRWLHIIGVVGKDEYEARWGHVSGYQSLSEYMLGAREIPDWMPEGRVVIAEYYTLDVEERVKLRLSTGHTIWKEEFPKLREMFAEAYPDAPLPEVARERLVETKVCRWSLHNAIQVLEGNEDLTGGKMMPGSRIPVFPLIGDEYDLDGEVDYRGMTRDARDPQKMYNFWSSSIAEAVALAPKAPWIAAKGQVENYIDDWKRANREAKAVLLYDPKAVGDVLVPPPQRNVAEPAIQAMVMGLSESDRDLKSVMGLFEPSLGDRREGDSGKAILAMQQQGQVSNSNYLDNLQRMKRAIGRSLLEWAPVIYDVARVVHLLQPDGRKKEAVVYAGAENKPKDDEFGDITEMYDLGVGHYDVTVTTAPGYPTEKQATEALLLELFKVLPPLAAIGADLLLENSDNPAAQQLAKRAKKTLPPQFQDESDPESQLPKLTMQVQQQQELLDRAHAAIEAMAGVLKTKELENDTKMQITQLQTQSKMAIELAKLGNARDLAAFSAQVQRMTQIVDVINQQAIVESQALNAETTQTRQMAHEATAQQTDLTAQAGSQERAIAAGEASQATDIAAQQQMQPKPGEGGA